MASNTVLHTAIQKLKLNTKTLLEKRSKCSTKKEIEEINNLITKNESMILDYEFRIANDKG